MEPNIVHKIINNTFLLKKITNWMLFLTSSKTKPTGYIYVGSCNNKWRKSELKSPLIFFWKLDTFHVPSIGEMTDLAFIKMLHFVKLTNFLENLHSLGFLKRLAQSFLEINLLKLWSNQISNFCQNKVKVMWKEYSVMFVQFISNASRLHFKKMVYF